MKNIRSYFGFLSIILVLSACGSGEKNAPEEDLAVFESTNVPEIDKLNVQLRSDPQNPNLYYQRGKSYYEHQGFDQAIVDLSKAIGLDSNQVEFYHLLADVYMDYFKSKPALNTMEFAAKKFNQRIPTLLKLGEFQMILELHTESTRTVDKILKLDAHNAEAFFLLGLNLKETKDTARAINAFNKAVEYDSELVDAWITMGNLFAGLNKPIAERYFNTALNIQPDDPDVIFSRGSYHYSKSNLEKAKADFLSVTRIDKQNSPAFFNIGLIYLEQDSIPKANQFFDFAVKTNPVYVMAYYYRGVCAEIMNNKSAALSDYKQVLTFDPDFKDTAERLEKLKKNS